MAKRSVSAGDTPPSDRSGLEAWVKRFLTSYLPQHRGVTANTVASYAQALRGFLNHLSARRKRRGEPTFRDLTAENVLAYLSELETRRGNSIPTRNARLAGVLSFLRYAFVMGRLDREPYERLRHIAFKRGSLKIVPSLSVDELAALFRAVDHRTCDGFRDITILKLLYNTGARASEVAAIKISDLSLGDLRVTVTGKGRKERTCGLWETTAALIRIYLASERRTPRRGFEDYLFISQRRRPLTRFGIHDIVRRYALRAASHCPALAKKTVTPHIIRHTTAVHLLAAGVDINTVRDWLGHEHISTTERYARASLQMKRLALDKLRQIDRKLFDKIAADRSKPEMDPGIRRWLDSLSD
jgi:site-specific recombinase XerD